MSEWGTSGEEEVRIPVWIPCLVTPFVGFVDVIVDVYDNYNVTLELVLSFKRGKS